MKMRKLHQLFNVHALTAAALFNKQQQLHDNSMSSELRCNCSNYFPHKEHTNEVLPLCVSARLATQVRIMNKTTTQPKAKRVQAESSAPKLVRLDRNDQQARSYSSGSLSLNLYESVTQNAAKR